METTIIKYDMDITPLSQIIEDAITVPLLEDLKIIIIKNPKFLTKGLDSPKSDVKILLNI